MHSLMTSLVTLGAVGAFATSVLAASDGDTQAGSAAGSQQVQIKGQRSAKVPEQEFAAMRGAYRLTDGRLLLVGGARQHATAELGNMGPMTLLSVGPNKLASADGSMVLHFNARANGDIDEVVVSLPAAGIQVSSSRF
jgi:hypothetical protein